MIRRLAWVVILAAAAAGCLTGSGAVRGAADGPPTGGIPAATAGR